MGRRQVVADQCRNRMVVAKDPFGIGQRGLEQRDTFMRLIVLEVGGREAVPAVQDVWVISALGFSATVSTDSKSSMASPRQPAAR